MSTGAKAKKAGARTPDAPSRPRPRRRTTDPRELDPIPESIDALMTREMCARVIACSLRKFDKMVAAKEFPAPDRTLFQPPVRRWFASTVQRWLRGESPAAADAESP